MKPILFSTPMVKSILAGNKTQTRRIIKPQPIIDFDSGYVYWKNERWDIHGQPLSHDLLSKSKYQIEDILWVRETWTWEGDTKYTDIFPLGTFFYKADNGDFHPNKWKPSIFMPREAARIYLKVTNIKVERLQDISEEDAIEEGIEGGSQGGWKSYEIIHTGTHKGTPHPHSVFNNKNSIVSYRELWESINGKGSWDLNPWVWVNKFHLTSIK